MKVRLTLVLSTMIFILSCGIPSPLLEEHSGKNRKILIFHDHIPWKDVESHLTDWKSHGITVVTPLPLIHGAVLDIPSIIRKSGFNNHKHIAHIEDDVKIHVNPAAKTAGRTFIRPVSKPQANFSAWNHRHLFNLPYTPGNIIEEIKRSRPDLVKQALCRMRKQNNMKIAVFDTGIHGEHKHLRNALAGGIDLVAHTGSTPRKQIQRKGAPTEDTNGHGTHIAGIIACLTDDGGGWGQNSPARLYSVKILDTHASGHLSNIIAGLQWAISHNIRIVNMSMGYRQESPAIARAIREAYEAGLVMVASVGNQANWETGHILSADGGAAGGSSFYNNRMHESPSYAVMYPARYPEVLAVGAGNAFGSLARFSNTGREMDVIAPGTDILSFDVTNGNREDGFGVCSGTSQAAPHVTAAIAMMLALNPKLGPHTIRNILLETARPSNTPAGHINLQDALYRVAATLKEKDGYTEQLNRKHIRYRRRVKGRIRKTQIALW